MGAGPPPMVTFLKKVAIASGTESSCGSPTRPTAPPGRAIRSAVKVDSSRPTHSRTECAPRSSVSPRTRSTASSPRLRDAHGFALSAVDVVEAVPAAMEAFALQTLLAEHTGAVGPQERRDDHVSGLDGLDVGANGLDDADELVAHAAAGVAVLHRLV